MSPRAGVVFKPVAPVSLYGSYSVSYLPSSGDQFASLTTITQQVEPERFDNYEVGAKWDLRGLALTTARVPPRSDQHAGPPIRTIRPASSRPAASGPTGSRSASNGQVRPGWSIAGGYAYQDAFVTSATAAARAGAQVGQVPHHTFSLWNNYRITPRAVGRRSAIVHRSVMFATIDNTVTLPGYTRSGCAAFMTLRKGLRLQANVENLFDTRYFVNADSNTNISPGAPRLDPLRCDGEFLKRPLDAPGLSEADLLASRVDRVEPHLRQDAPGQAVGPTFRSGVAPSPVCSARVGDRHTIVHA